MSHVTNVNGANDYSQNVFEMRHKYNKNSLDVNGIESDRIGIALNEIAIPKNDNRFLHFEIKKEIIDEEEKLSSEDAPQTDHYNLVHNVAVKKEIILDTDVQGNIAVDTSRVPEEIGNPVHFETRREIELDIRCIKAEKRSSEETPQSPDQSLDSGYNVPLENDSFITNNEEVKVEVLEDHRQENEGASRSKKYESQETPELSKRPDVCTSAEEISEGVSNVQGPSEDTNKRSNALRNMDPKRKIPCDYCDFKTTFKYLMKIHLRTHTGEKPFLCNYCQQRFPYQSSLLRHLRRRHTGEKTLTCDYCEQKFRLKTVLLKHITTEHTGQKTFRCGYCEKVFSRKNNLTRHLMTHTGEKPFVCTLCEKHFTQKHGLLKHLKIHAMRPTRIKPFTCSYCEHQFTLKRNFIRHLKVLHNVENPCV